MIKERNSVIDLMRGFAMFDGDFCLFYAESAGRCCKLL